MKILYTRTSTVQQNTDRQKVNEQDYNIVLEDKCSGSISLFEREQGKQLKKYIDEGICTELGVWTLDRLGRNLKDILNTIEYCNERNINIKFIQQGIQTIDSNGKFNSITKMIISVLGIVSEMEREQIRERTREGIELAKLKGKYSGRKRGTNENILQFLSKPKNKKVLDLLDKGYKGTEISKIVGINLNTITKIRKCLV